jgi:branched-chain amino acid transport system ATP-binding protein
VALLEVRNMTHHFGGLRAVHEYNLQIEPGQIRGLIGPNGAGKTTIFNLITGRYSPTEGDILLSGTRINGLQPYEIAAKRQAEELETERRAMGLLEMTGVGQYASQIVTNLPYGAQRRSAVS